MLKAPEPATAGLRTSWSLLVSGVPAGVLQLWASPAGYQWKWARKPAEFVDLLGIDADTQTEVPQKTAWRFSDTDQAIDHLLYCTGVAFPWRCGLAAA